MARSVRAGIERRSTRLRLPARKEPYWQSLQQGVSAGYYRPASGGDGTWWGRVRCNGRYLVQALATADDHVDADGERVLNWGQAQAAIRDWGVKQGKTGPLTVGEAIADYLDDLRARKGERAATAAGGRFDKHVPAAFRAGQVADLTTRELRQWRNGLVPESGEEERLRRARDTANRVLTNLRAALNHAFRNDRVSDDKAWRRVEPFENVGVARKVILEPIELQRLVDACEPGMRELVAVGAQTGARLGELTNARVRDFDPAAGTLQLKGKTGAREIHLAPATVSILRQTASGKRPGDFLLPPDDRPHWTRNLHTKRFSAAVRRAGVDPETTFYALRHTYISHALRGLVPVKAVADHCGTSMVMVERHYAKFIVADRRRYAEIAAPELRIDGAAVTVVALRHRAAR